MASATAQAMTVTSGSPPDQINATTNPAEPPAVVDIKDLLRRLWPKQADVTAEEISDAIAHFFTNQVDDVQTAALLMCLHFTGLDSNPKVLSQCAVKMLQAAAQVDAQQLRRVIETRGRKVGTYQGGFVDIVGTGGDAHNTFNISTASSILASSLLLVAKHGNRASTSKSGSADLIAHMASPTPLNMAAVESHTLARIYERTNYAFLFAPLFHPGMRFVSPTRRKLPWRTIFNLLGPLANPMDVPGSPLIEARVLGVARRELGPIYAEALRMNNVRKAMVVCGEEDLDEVSCAGPTLCWWVLDGTVQHFKLTPEDFGLSRHPLGTVASGLEPAENAAILRRLLQGELAQDDPIVDFVLMNTATLLVVSGVCDGDGTDLDPSGGPKAVTETGPGGGRWKEGVRRARWAIKSGEAWRQWNAFVAATNSISS